MLVANSALQGRLLMLQYIRTCGTRCSCWQTVLLLSETELGDHARLRLLAVAATRWISGAGCPGCRAELECPTARTWMIQVTSPSLRNWRTRAPACENAVASNRSACRSCCACANIGENRTQIFNTRKCRPISRARIGPPPVDPSTTARARRSATPPHTSLAWPPTRTDTIPDTQMATAKLLQHQKHTIQQ